LHPDIDLNELKKVLSLEHGESMKLLIRRADDQVFSVIVRLDSTLKDLKGSIKDHFTQKHKRSPADFPKAVNWQYVWKNYCLMFEEEKLTENSKQLRDYGIKNKCELTFFKFSFRKNK
jgi:U11/U12 small nuclear ribonucleoprotein SNRNP25